MSRRLKKLVRRAEELGISDGIADLLESYVAAAEAYEDNREHGVTETETVMLSTLPAAVWTLGELAQIEYDREEDGRMVRRYHPFEDERPLLAVGVDDAKLWIVGGDYTVEDRGIVG